MVSDQAVAAAVAVQKMKHLMSNAVIPPFDSFVEPEETSCTVSVDFSTVPHKDIVETSKSNMFWVAEAIEANLQRSLTKEQLDDLFKYILSLQDCDSYLIRQSYQALLASNAESWIDRQNADLVNGLIITD